ncbi:MAG: heme-binding domain-containing protein [Bacteroidota bacterium]
MGLLIVLVGMQCYHPEKMDRSDYLASYITKTNPPVEVRVVLRGTCYNCHSNTTIYPWYTYVASVIYGLADHMEEGKEDLNLSDWDGYSAKKKVHKLEEVAEMVEKEEMPLGAYTWTHAEARLTKEQKRLIID